MSGSLGESGNALRLFSMGPGQSSDLGLQRGEQPRQFPLAFLVEGTGILQLGFDF